jgi:tRNA dimethylallyltransferase
MIKVIVIAGPTASGKSAAALELADRRGGEIIDADAMQVYRDLRILTARPTEDELQRVPHHLYGVSGGGDAWSAGRFARRAAATIEAVAREGGLPVVVGGTGLWLKALTDGLSPIPEPPPESVAEAGRVLDDQGLEGLREILVRHDPAMARLHPNDRQRHLRAYAVLHATGRPLGEWQRQPPQREIDINVHGFILEPPRDRLYARIDTRFEEMVEQGAVEEVRRLEASGVPATAPVRRAVGVPELAAFIRGETDLDKAIAAAQQSSRRLAKRQMTWFRNQFADWCRCTDTEQLRLQWAQAANRPPFDA